jgi:hypothetical protein
MPVKKIAAISKRLGGGEMIEMSFAPSGQYTRKVAVGPPSLALLCCKSIKLREIYSKYTVL